MIFKDHTNRFVTCCQLSYKLHAFMHKCQQLFKAFRVPKIIVKHHIHVLPVWNVQFYNGTHWGTLWKTSRNVCNLKHWGHYYKRCSSHTFPRNASCSGLNTYTHIVFIDSPHLINLLSSGLEESIRANYRKKKRNHLYKEYLTVHNHMSQIFILLGL